ncbi:hypothetical protein [Larkinella soli]|uniref:hypothetical protein n=1 Tax=Larkinella soli TaxID=1770527 RepID=UPI000FFC1CCF|nr:hypothetical protein [Larkinella soli]
MPHRLYIIEPDPALGSTLNQSLPAEYPAVEVAVFDELRKMVDWVILTDHFPSLLLVHLQPHPERQMAGVSRLKNDPLWKPCIFIGWAGSLSWTQVSRAYHSGFHSVHQLDTALPQGLKPILDYWLTLPHLPLLNQAHGPSWSKD